MIFVPRVRFLSLASVVFLLCLSLVFLQISNYGTFATLVFFSVLLYYISNTGLKIKIYENKIAFNRLQISQDVNFENINKIFFSTEAGGLQLLLHFQVSNSNSVNEIIAIDIKGYANMKTLVNLLIRNTINLNPDVEIDPRILQQIQS